MGQCDPEVGCPALVAIKDELNRHNLEQVKVVTQGTARIDSAAEKVEGMVESFEKCLIGIEKHTLTLNDGKHVMESLEKDVDNVAEAGRVHAVLADGSLSNHRTIEKDMEKESNRNIWSFSVLAISIGTLYVTIFSSPLAPQLWKGVKRLLGMG